MSDWQALVHKALAEKFPDGAPIGKVVYVQVDHDGDCPMKDDGECDCVPEVIIHSEQ